MPRLSNLEILACIDAIACECTRKIAEYEHMRDTVERLRAQVAPSEDVPRFLDTHELVSQRFGRRRTA